MFKHLHDRTGFLSVWENVIGSNHVSFPSEADFNGAPVVARGYPLPERLREDAIVEALFEMRFEMSSIQEVFFGRIIESPRWKGIQQRRLPAYDIPQPIRQADPNFKFQPVLEVTDLRDPVRPCFIRLGPQVLSYHRSKTYVGWTAFREELDSVIDMLFSSAEGLVVHRLGLRYMNAMTPARHNVRSISDLDLSAKVADSNLLSGNVNINYNVEYEAHKCLVRVATPDFVSGVLPEQSSVFVDVDVFTEGLQMEDKEAAKEWASAAHTIEKTEFFHLLAQETIEHLREI